MFEDGHEYEDDYEFVLVIDLSPKIEAEYFLLLVCLLCPDTEVQLRPPPFAWWN